MNRRWRREAAPRLQTLLTPQALLASFETPHERPLLPLADGAAVYSVYSALRATGAAPTCHVHATGGFRYFLAPPPECVVTAKAGPGQKGSHFSLARGEGGAEANERCVPVQAASGPVTPATLAGLLAPDPPGSPAPPYILLAMADRDGTVSFQRLYQGMQPPAAGPPGGSDDEDGGEGEVGAGHDGVSDDDG